MSMWEEGGTDQPFLSETKPKIYFKAEQTTFSQGSISYVITSTGK